MEPLKECESSGMESEAEEPPPEFNAEDVLRQLSETLSAMNCDGSSSESLPSTVMLRNIPNKYTAGQLMEEFGKFGFRGGDIDFFYLPIDFRNVCNVGFAFVNFSVHERAVEFMHAFENYRLPATNSSKICAVCWARIQGREANIAQYKDSPISEEYRPWLFNKGSGEREAFPEPDPLVMRSIEKSSKEAQRASNATKGPDANKIFVGGLNKATIGSDLVKYFSKYGPVKDAAVVIDRTSGKSRGFGFCLFQRAVPKPVLLERHVIEDCEVAVKMYQESSGR
jgi:RNA recognition motif-containing protein